MSNFSRRRTCMLILGGTLVSCAVASTAQVWRPGFRPGFKLGVTSSSPNTPIPTPTPSPSLISAYRDDFQTGPGTINGRTITGLVNYATVLSTGPDYSTLDSITVDTSGKGNLSGQYQTRAFAYRVPTSASDYMSMKLGPSGNQGPDLAYHITADNVAPTYLSVNVFNYSGGGINIQPIVGGVAGTQTTIQTESPGEGDVLEMRTVRISNVNYAEITINGRLVGQQTGGLWVDGRFNLDAANIPLTGKHGWHLIGVNSFDMAEGGDMTTVSRLVSLGAARVVQLNQDGTEARRMAFSYTGPLPTEIKYRVHLNSDNTVVFSGTTTNLTVDDTTKTGFTTVSFTPASPTTGYWTELYRENAVNALGATAEVTSMEGPVLAGDVYITDGQSLNIFADTSGSTVTSSAPDYGYSLAANSATPTYLRQQSKVVANSSAATFMNSVTAVTSKPILMIAGGVGGSSISTRGVGSAAATAINDAVSFAGGAIRFAKHIDGQTDLSSLASYKTTLVALYTDRFNRWGNFPVILYPITTAIGYGDVGVEAMRRYQAFELPLADSRFVSGPFTMDQQHNFSGTNVDQLHLKDYSEMERRAGFIAGAFLNPAIAAFDHKGPSLSTITKIDNTTVDVSFNLSGFTSLTLLNSGYTTNKTDVFEGGLRFGSAVGTPSGGTSNTITTPLTVASASFGSTSKGKITVRYTFTTPTAGVIYVGGPYGANPFNKSNDNDINLDLANKASILVGGKAGEPPVPIQPFYQANGNDYLSSL